MKALSNNFITYQLILAIKTDPDMQHHNYKILYLSSE